MLRVYRVGPIRKVAAMLCFHTQEKALAEANTCADTSSRRPGRLAVIHIGFARWDGKSGPKGYDDSECTVRVHDGGMACK